MDFMLFDPCHIGIVLRLSPEHQFLPMKLHKLFVYGTLKSGHGNNRYFLQGKGKLLGKAMTTEKFLLMSFGGCPGMYDADRAKGEMKEHVQQIQGELWECDDATRAAIDRLESHPHGWRRTPCKVILGHNGGLGGLTVDCETYIYQGSVHGEPCENGIWPRVHKLQHA